MATQCNNVLRQRLPLELIDSIEAVWKAWSIPERIVLAGVNKAFLKAYCPLDIEILRYIIARDARVLLESIRWHTAFDRGEDVRIQFYPNMQTYVEIQYQPYLLGLLKITVVKDADEISWTARFNEGRKAETLHRLNAWLQEPSPTRLLQEDPNYKYAYASLSHARQRMKDRDPIWLVASRHFVQRDIVYWSMIKDHVSETLKYPRRYGQWMAL